jgi:hypothetical protein
MLGDVGKNHIIKVNDDNISKWIEINSKRRREDTYDFGGVQFRMCDMRRLARTSRLRAWALEPRKTWPRTREGSGSFAASALRGLAMLADMSIS